VLFRSGKRIVRDASGAAIRPIAWEDDPERPLAPLLEAYRQAGTVLGACRLLNERGVPTGQPRKREEGDGPKLWRTTSLTNILVRAGACPARGQRRHYSRGHPLAGLLRCHCGRTMTPDGPKGGLYCARAKYEGEAVHGRGSIADRYIMPVIRAEADRLQIPFDGVELGQDDPAGRESLAERKRRLGLAFAAGALDEETFRAELWAVEKQFERLDAAAEIVDIPTLDWSAPAPAINAVLRTLFEVVQLGPDMKVAEIVWRVPEWRREA
jgi:hypothetical protein